MQKLKLALVAQKRTKGDLGHPSRPEYWRKLRSERRLLRTIPTLKPVTILPQRRVIFKILRGIWVKTLRNHRNIGLKWGF